MVSVLALERVLAIEAHYRLSNNRLVAEHLGLGLIYLTHPAFGFKLGI